MAIGDVRVRGSMTSEVVTVRGDATLRELQALFGRYGIDVVPVVGRDELGGTRLLLGIATRADLLKALLGAKTMRALETRWARPVSAILREVEPLRPSDLLATAAGRLVGSGIPALPVIDASSRVIGILSLADILDRNDGGRVLRASL